MIQPTIGRVVWYRERDQPKDAQPNAALIAYVHSDTMVNLAVFDFNGVARSETSVYLHQGDDDFDPGDRYCEWMPYQQGQAAKTEALQKQLQEAPALITRCKMRVALVLTRETTEGHIEQEQVTLVAVIGDANSENGKWSKWTPAATFDITITNPDVFGKLSEGHEYFVDFSPAT
jgi:hypothetical protein